VGGYEGHGAGREKGVYEKRRDEKFKTPWRTKHRDVACM